MNVYFRKQTGHDLKQTLFEMLSAVEGDVTSSILAINEYFEALQKGPLLVE